MSESLKRLVNGELVALSSVEIAEVEAIRAITLEDIGTALCDNIDDEVAAVYARPQRFIKEYEEREAQARDFAARGFSGEAPPRIAGFATASGLTPQAAAELTIAQADNLRGALGALADLRMMKYRVKAEASKTNATEGDVRAVHASIVQSIHLIASQLT